MERTISIKDLKSKIGKREVTVVETLGTRTLPEAHIPGALPVEKAA